jgi:hypothetical protein
MMDMIGPVFLVKGDGRLGPSKLHRGDEGVNDIHLLFSDMALLARFVGMGAHEDHEAALGLGELSVFLLGTSRWVTNLQGKLMGLALLVEGAANVALHGSVVLEEVLRLPSWNGQGASSAFSKCSR